MQLSLKILPVVTGCIINISIVGILEEGGFARVFVFQ